MMQTSESIATIATALAKAQSELANVTKDRENPHFHSTYATLAAVLDVCRPVLSAHGIAIIQAPANDENGRVSITTRLLHSSGEWLQCVVAVRAGKDDAQGIGSVVSYLRRYSLAAMVGVAQADDDGNAASNGNQPDRREDRKPEPPKLDASGHDPSWTEDRARFCAALKGNLGLKYEDVAEFCAGLRRPRPSAMTVAGRQAMFGYLESTEGQDKYRAFLVYRDRQWCKANLAILAFPPEAAEVDTMPPADLALLVSDIKAATVNP